MRASFWVIAPLLARMHEAKVSLPGAAPSAPVGRSVDHGAGEARRGTYIDGGYVVAKAPGGLKAPASTFPR